MRRLAARQNVLFCAFATSCQLTIEAAHIGGYLRCPGKVNYTALGEASSAATLRCVQASIAYGTRRRLGYKNPKCERRPGPARGPLHDRARPGLRIYSSSCGADSLQGRDDLIEAPATCYATTATTRSDRSSMRPSELRRGSRAIAAGIEALRRALETIDACTTDPRSAMACRVG